MYNTPNKIENETYKIYTDEQLKYLVNVHLLTEDEAEKIANGEIASAKDLLMYREKNSKIDGISMDESFSASKKR